MSECVLVLVLVFRQFPHLVTCSSVLYMFVLFVSICFLFNFPPFIYFRSHLHCITRFEDEDAICKIKYQVTRINGEGRI